MNQNGLIAYTDYRQSMELLHFEDITDTKTTADPTVCSVTSKQLTCNIEAPKILMLCPGFAVINDVFIGVSLEPAPCVSPTFKVVPVCVVP